MPETIFAVISLADYEKGLLTSAQSGVRGGCSAPDLELPCIRAAWLYPLWHGENRSVYKRLDRYNTFLVLHLIC